MNDTAVIYFSRLWHQVPFGSELPQSIPIEIVVVVTDFLTYVDFMS